MNKITTKTIKFTSTRMSIKHLFDYQLTFKKLFYETWNIRYNIKIPQFGKGYLIKIRRTDYVLMHSINFLTFNAGCNNFNMHECVSWNKAEMAYESAIIIAVYMRNTPDYIWTLNKSSNDSYEKL